MHALEVHNPRYCVHAPALDTHAGGSGHLAQGKMAEWCAANGEDEDTTSMALTATRRLMSRCGVKQIEVHRTPIASHSWLAPLLPSRYRLCLLYFHIPPSCAAIHAQDTCLSARV